MGIHPGYDDDSDLFRSINSFERLTEVVAEIDKENSLALLKLLRYCTVKELLRAKGEAYDDNCLAAGSYDASLDTVTARSKALFTDLIKGASAEQVLALHDWFSYCFSSLDRGEQMLAGSLEAINSVYAEWWSAHVKLLQVELIKEGVLSEGVGFFDAPMANRLPGVPSVEYVLNALDEIAQRTPSAVKEMFGCCSVYDFTG